MVILNILLLVLILGVLIFIHELGHFLVAKKCNVHIYEFALGMGPVIFQKTGKDKIVYSLRAFPIGGYVQMAGEVGEDDDKVKKDRFMCNRPWYQRLLILIAGVTMNFILALVFLFFIALIWGTVTLKPVINKVTPDTPVEKAGIVAGDTITEINGKKVKTWDKAQLLLTMKSKNDTYEIKIKHEDGSYDTYDIKPSVTENEDGEEKRVFGIEIKGEEQKGVLNAFKYAGTKFISIMESMAMVVGGLFTGKLSLDALSGPVGMYSVVDQSAQAGLSSILYLMAFLSVNLGFINILPFPAFDGGRVLFLIIEKIKGSPVDSKVENIIHTIGFFLLLILMIVITFKDILRIF